MDLVSDITIFVTKYADVIREIERPSYTVQDKIKRYEDVIAKIQEYEAKLVSASDKGEQIANEGTAVDRNSIMEQLQQLKQQLLSLRKIAEQQIQQHEATAAEQAKLVNELENVIDWLYNHEAEIQSRPLLLISVDSVNEEIAKHQVMYFQKTGISLKRHSIPIMSVLTVAGLERGSRKTPRACESDQGKHPAK